MSIQSANREYAVNVILEEAQALGRRQGEHSAIQRQIDTVASVIGKRRIIFHSSQSLS